MCKKFFLPVFLLYAAVSFSQKDSTQLPFAIADEKKLSEEDLTNKKEGTYLTGVPDLSFDPINGFGAGAEAQIFFNGKRTDPLFAYTPFRANINLAVFYTTKNQKKFAAEWEVPYIFNTKWRLHGELGYEVDPNLLYFGSTEESLKPLSNNSSIPPLVNANFSEYENSLTGKKMAYNHYQMNEAIINIILHRSFLHGKMRFFFGFELSLNKIYSPLNDSSLLHLEYLNGKILGYGNNVVPLYQSGVIYDTRDLETSPSKGSFMELMNEVSAKKLGSDFDFWKIFFHHNYYCKIFPNELKKCVFASIFALGNTIGNPPFYEFSHEESTERSFIALGGEQSLRGYKQSRFVGRIMHFADVEIRYRFLQVEKFKQHFEFSIVPFIDEGAVWNSWDRISHTENFRFSEGIGLRIGWNENTTLRFDFAISKEDKQFFFALVQPF